MEDVIIRKTNRNSHMSAVLEKLGPNNLYAFSYFNVRSVTNKYLVILCKNQGYPNLYLDG